MAKKRKSRRLALIGLDLFLFAGIVFVSYLIVASSARTANLRAEIQLVEQEASRLYEAFERYYERNKAYPNSHLEPRFGIYTLDPLSKRGYYRGHLLSRLLDSRVDGYDSPDDSGLNQEFWLEFSLASDPRVRFLIAKSDDAPLGAGAWCEGVFIYRGGDLEQL